VIVNLNAFDVGRIGRPGWRTLLNLAARAICQAVLPARRGMAVTLVVDEFHTLGPGADMNRPGELAKYGANVLLASQTMSRLDRLTTPRGHAISPRAVFSNLDDCSLCIARGGRRVPGRGARWYARCAGPARAGPLQCYARVSDARTGEPPAASASAGPPPEGDAHSQRRSLDCRQSAMVATLWMWSSIFRRAGAHRGPRRGATLTADAPRPARTAAPDIGTPAPASRRRRR